MINIAVIDDDETVCGNLKRIIGKYDMKFDYNIRCDVFTSCEDFMERAQGDEYKLIFLDIEFPEMSGIELSVKIRNYFKNIKCRLCLYHQEAIMLWSYLMFSRLIFL